VAFPTTILTEDIVAFTQQQLLRESATMLRYTYTTRRVVSQQ